jgi:hypothetical protein
MAIVIGTPGIRLATTLRAGCVAVLFLGNVPAGGALFALHEFESDFVNTVDSSTASTSGFTTPGFTTGPVALGQAVSFIDNQGHEVWRNIQTSGLSFSSLTIAFWVNTQQSNWRAPVTLEALTGPEHRIAFQISAAGHIYLANVDGLSGASGIWTDPNPNAHVSDGEWHHVAWTADSPANSSILYVDGEQVGANTWAATADVKLWMLGKLKDSVVNNYTGDIDDYRIYDEVLTQNQIRDLIPVIPEPNTVALLLFAGLLFGRRFLLKQTAKPR